MPNLDRILGLFGVLALFAVIIGFQVFVGLAILSMLIVPITYLFCLVNGRSYNSVIDSSNMLYKMNKFGQWVWLVIIAIVVFYIFLFKLL
jgi:hypothetical protein